MVSSGAMIIVEYYNAKKLPTPSSSQRSRCSSLHCSNSNRPLYFPKLNSLLLVVPNVNKHLQSSLLIFHQTILFHLTSLLLFPQQDLKAADFRITGTISSINFALRSSPTALTTLSVPSSSAHRSSCKRSIYSQLPSSFPSSDIHLTASIW